MRWDNVKVLRMPDGVSSPYGQFGRELSQSFAHSGHSFGRAPTSVGTNCLLQLRQEPQEGHLLRRGSSHAIRGTAHVRHLVIDRPDFQQALRAPAELVPPSAAMSTVGPLFRSGSDARTAYIVGI